MAFSDVGSTMSSRPDRPLVVKATFDRYNKRITFSSARNCSYDLLRRKLEQSFALSAFSFSIAYKDDDGEVTDITTDADLTEAIQYFQAGVDDLPVSSAQSILSGRSFGYRKVTLRVNITVDYDGPSLSDTSSLASIEDYKNRNGSESSLSFGSAVQIEPDDDSVTVSSRDTGFLVAKTVMKVGGGNHSTPPTVHDFQSYTGIESDTASHIESRDVATRFPADPSAVFERLKLSEASQQGSSESNERSAQWLRDQKSRTTFNGLIGEAESVSDASESNASSLSFGKAFDDSEQSPLDGDLALQQNARGSYYYTYTSGSSASSASQLYAHSYADDEISLGEHESHRVAECAAPKLHWIASQQTLREGRGKPRSHTDSYPSTYPSTYPSSSSRPSVPSTNSDPLPRESLSMFGADEDIPPEVLQFVSQNPQPPSQCTDCSECGCTLDQFRYVCSTCGEKTPKLSHEVMHTTNPVDMNGKGKERDISMFDPLAYPPALHRTPIASTSSASSSWSSLIDFDTPSINKPLPPRPLPTLPPNGRTPSATSLSSSPSFVHSNSSSTLAPSRDGRPPLSQGYELCGNCIESAGVFHALAAGTDSEANPEPSSPEDAQRTLSQWRRTAPKQKGYLRHAFSEKVWSATGWKDVEQDDMVECTICNTSLTSQRYKCASCQKFVLCRACYSQVHEIHPSHAFLVVPDRPLQSRSAPELDLGITFDETLNDDGLGEQSLTHLGVKCAHCLMDIVGARFHCAICENVDICSNCEAAGLPGNLNAADGGHNNEHIMIKIPIPLNSTKVQTASRRAKQLWDIRDGPSAQRPPGGRSRANSLGSGIDARTVLGSSAASAHRTSERDPMDHRMNCKGCGQNIVGLRYQCATCPSTPTQQYSLCANCEPRSYILHDPMHIFFKLPRPVSRPIESQFAILPVLYRQPAGPPNGQANTSDPKAYLQQLYHTAALCDHCMERIRGEWFRCVYCAKDLCDVCESLDSHDNTHFFFVFKAPVNMQIFRHVADLDNTKGSPPVLNFPVYYS